MTVALAAPTLVRLDRGGVQRHLPQLDGWLLPDAFYGVQHTWPQLYRSDGDGTFFVLLDGDRLLSHCACRVVTVHGVQGPVAAALLGSVATDPAVRGRGLASRVLTAALAECERTARQVLLWAERDELYARHGFVAGRPEQALTLVRRPRPDLTGVRLARVADHAAIHALHEQKPLRVERSPAVTSGLLTTPGMWTVVLEDRGRVIAYACTGKGSDLQGYWHELGGSDRAVATLLPAALHLVDQIEAIVLVPPYRTGLAPQLGRAVVDAFAVPGPMVHAFGRPPADCWIDGLDSV